jgi:DNA recombination protein RmuC
VPEPVYLVLALVCAVAAWFVSRARAERSLNTRLREAEERAAAREAEAAAAVAREGELRAQFDRRETDLTQLRTQLTAEQDARSKADARLEEARRGLDEQRELLEAMKKELTDTFGALSAAALKSSSEDFLRLASEHLGKVVVDTKGRLGEHKAALDGLIRPLNEALKKYEENVRHLELKRRQDYTSLDEQIKALATTHRDLQKETGNLVSALRKPHVRGRWGEVTLRNVVELAGMSAHCDFTEQLSLSTEHGRLRPDMLVHLPGGHDIVVDAKVSLEALLDASEAPTEEDRREAMKRHGSHVKEQVNRLGSKSYWDQFEKSPDLAVLFMGEAALVAALEVEPTVMEDSMRKRVLIATPTTLFALLTAVAYGWRQEQVTRNAEAIAALGRELYDRVGVWGRHLGDVGKDLGRAVEAYNRAVGSMEARVMPSVRKFRELGAAGGEELPELPKAEQTPRNLSLTD